MTILERLSARLSRSPKAGVAQGPRLRVGMLRIAQESNALSPRLSELSDFRHDLSGAELMQATSRDAAEVPGFIRDAELSGFRQAVAARGEGRLEVVPLFSVWAVPAGPLSARALTALRARLSAALDAAGDLDGVFVSLHGAMVGEDNSRPETELLQDLRRRVGDDVPIAATIDLHAHLTRDFMAPLDILAGYRTNPHRDHAAAGRRCGEMLVDTLLGRMSPTMAWRTLPMVIGGGTTIDFLPTSRPLFRWMKRAERNPAVRAASLCMSHMWLDAPDLGWATCVVTDGDQQLAERLAEELADKAWAIRNALPPEFPGAVEAIEQARSARLRRKLGTVCMSDASDMVGAGAPGDNTRLLSALLEHGHDLTTYSALRDERAVEQLWQTRVGSAVEVTLGGTHPDSPALAVSGHLQHRMASEAFGRVLVLDLGHVKLVVTSEAPLAMKPAFYHDVGLDPARADICVVKSLFPFRLYFAAYNRLTIYAKTRGATDFDAAWRQHYDLPTHPKDVVDSWRPADRVRRLGLSVTDSD